MSFFATLHVIREDAEGELRPVAQGIALPGGQGELVEVVGQVLSDKNVRAR